MPPEYPKCRFFLARQELGLAEKQEVVKEARLSPPAFLNRRYIYAPSSLSFTLRDVLSFTVADSSLRR